MLPAAAVPGMAEEVFSTIRDVHPIGFRAEGIAALEGARSQVQGKVESVVQGRDSIAYHEFAALVAPLQRVTGCGHLILLPYRDSLTDVRLRENRFPIAMYPDPETGKYFLREGLRTTTDSLPPGTDILSINGVPTGALVQQVSVFSGVNDQGNDRAGRVAVARFFSTPYQRYYGLQDSIVIQLDPARYTPATRAVYPRHRPYVDPKKTLTDINKTLQFRLSEDGAVGILTIRSFKAIRFNNGNYYRYIREVMDSLNTGGIDKLIIDIRGNTGGRAERITSLYSYLSTQKFYFAENAALTGPAKAVAGESTKDRKRRERGAVTRRERKLHRMITRKNKPAKARRRFTGEVIVLIDEVSFSASGMFARYVQGSGRGLLVGATSGASAGVTYGSNSDGKHLLGPRDDFSLWVNSIALQLPYATTGNVVPDVEVPLTAGDVRAGKDLALEKALELPGQTDR